MPSIDLLSPVAQCTQAWFGLRISNQERTEMIERYLAGTEVTGPQLLALVHERGLLHPEVLARKIGVAFRLASLEATPPRSELDVRLTFLKAAAGEHAKQVDFVSRDAESILEKLSKYIKQNVPFTSSQSLMKEIEAAERMGIGRDSMASYQYASALSRRFVELRSKSVMHAAEEHGLHEIVNKIRSFERVALNIDVGWSNRFRSDADIARFVAPKKLIKEALLRVFDFDDKSQSFRQEHNSVIRVGDPEDNESMQIVRDLSWRVGLDEMKAEDRVIDHKISSEITYIQLQLAVGTAREEVVRHLVWFCESFVSTGRELQVLFERLKTNETTQFIVSDSAFRNALIEQVKKMQISTDRDLTVAGILYMKERWDSLRETTNDAADQVKKLPKWRAVAEVADSAQFYMEQMYLDVQLVDDDQSIVAGYESVWADLRETTDQFSEIKNPQGAVLGQIKRMQDAVRTLLNPGYMRNSRFLAATYGYTNVNPAYLRMYLGNTDALADLLEFLKGEKANVGIISDWHSPGATD